MFTQQKQFKPLRFALPPVSHTNRIIFAGLFPPKNSRVAKQHLNATSEEISLSLGHHNFDWIDIFPFAPITEKKFPWHQLDKFLQQTPNFALHWNQLIKARVNELFQHQHCPIIYVCGEICKKYWEGTVRVINQSFQFYQGKTESGLLYLVIFGPHPSQHFYAGKASITLFQRHMQLLSFCSKNQITQFSFKMISNFIQQRNSRSEAFAQQLFLQFS